MPGEGKHRRGLLSQNYGVLSSWGMDPIEKKPLHHFYPGSWIFSMGSVGCNFRCKFCQNYRIAQEIPDTTVKITPDEVIHRALSAPGNIGIAYTYNEPTVSFEFVLECAVLARQKGLKNVLVTNGFIEARPLEELLPYIDAMNIDIKGTETFYKDLAYGRLGPVKETVKMAYRHCHVEITHLIIPGMNDGEGEIEDLAGWISSLRRDIPLHLSRYFPSYRLHLPPTPVKAVERARDIALKYLDYVYTGNGGDPRSSNTYCPRCGALVIMRCGYEVKIHLEGKACPRCSAEISLVMG